ncbi:3-phosphoshikimate 1-carboxyvinyltransferase [Planctomycetaceae bacterium SH139]
MSPIDAVTDFAGANSAGRTVVEIMPGGPVVGAMRPPGSKSLTNRALICAALANGRSKLTDVLDSEDTRVMIAALQAVGVELDVDLAKQTIEVEGLAGSHRDQQAAEVSLEIGNSGTTIRFLTAALSALGGRYYLHGVPRMHQRPIADLIAAIEQLGGGAEALSPLGCPPVRIASGGWQRGEVTVAGAVSSQYLSGLLMAAPASRRQITVRIAGELVSRPYVDMTLTLMRDFGVRVDVVDESTFLLPADQAYQGRSYTIEPDASAASYPWAAAAISGGTVTVQGLHRQALQGDVAFVEVLAKMGCQVSYEANQITVSGRAARGIDVDMNAISDCVQTLAVVALFATGPTTIRGVGHNRFKETDRIGDLARELRKLGAEVTELDDGMRITPGELRGALLETYDDHRMAMSLALAGLSLPGVQIENPACTAKTYPHYFADLERLTGRAHHWSQLS